MPGFRNPRPTARSSRRFRSDLRCVADPPHGWFSSRDQVNGGANDGFVREHYASLLEEGLPPEAADQVMGYHAA